MDRNAPKPELMRGLADGRRRSGLAPNFLINFPGFCPSSSLAGGLARTGSAPFFIFGRRSLQMRQKTEEPFLGWDKF